MASTASPHSGTSPENYLGYLDKEMNIMGILSAFCVLTVGGVANAFRDVTFDDRSIASLTWHRAHNYIVAGCLCIMAAALFFYRQRSHLAWCYGQICLAQTDNTEYGSVESWLDEANGWSSWRSYKAAFAAIGAGFAEFVLVVVSARGSLISDNYFVIGLPVSVAVAYIAPMFYVMEAYDHVDNPWADFFTDLGVRKRKADAKRDGGTSKEMKSGMRAKRKSSSPIKHI